MNKVLKNINPQEVVALKELVTYQDGQVASKTLIQNDGVGLTLFAFDKGEGISTHESKGDAIVMALEGTGRITIDGIDYELHAGESIMMPADHPHAVYGIEQFKMLLIVTFPEMATAETACATKEQVKQELLGSHEEPSQIDGMSHESEQALKEMVGDSRTMIKEGRF